MSKPFRFASAASFVALAAMTAGCATPQKTGIREVKPVGEMGFATRAMAALNSDDPAAAIGFAERAVEKSPRDAGFRALLGNCYFAGGRFASAEGAYKDSLTIYENQPRVILKLVLVEIAQGKTADALNFLEAGKGVLDPSDYGLALALAGQPQAAVAVLDPAARATGADARVRQNLALAYALSGDWSNARTIAAQDVPADQLDGRIHQWMQLATPHRASDQVAALVGVTPAAADPGQPVQLALRKDDTRLAAAEPVAAPAASVTVHIRPAPVPQVAAAVAQAEPVAPSPPAPEPVEAPVETIAQAAMASPEAPAAFAAMMVNVPPRAPASARRRLLPGQSDLPDRSRLEW